jgi:hypothetical protein
MPGHVHVPALGDEIFGVVSLVGCRRDSLGAGNLLQHNQGSISLRRPIGFEPFRVDDQAIAVLHQQVYLKAQLCFLAAPFA